MIALNIYLTTFFFGTLSKQDASIIFRDAAALNMTEGGYVWIVSEQALNSKNAPIGTLGLRLVHATNEKAHIKDSMYVSFYLFIKKCCIFCFPRENRTTYL